MRKAFIIMVILVIIFAGCTAKPKATVPNKGTDGLLISFPDNLPPKTVYESRPFPVKFQIHNAGATPVQQSRMIITFNWDPLYIKGGMNPYVPATHSTERRDLAGRSLIYPEGEKRTYDIPPSNSFEAQAVPGQMMSPKTSLAASVCYAYNTFMSTDVCIDTDIYDESVRKQPCEAKPITLSGGQGAPIAITGVDVEAVPFITSNGYSEFVKPIFTIHLSDAGNGYLIGPDDLEMKTACLLTGIPKESLNAVKVNAHLFSTRLDCGPRPDEDGSGMVRLIDGKADITCTVPERELGQEIFAAKQNFKSSLSVNITYLYKTSTTREISLQRVPGGELEEPIGNEFGKISGYLYRGDTLATDASGRKITLCSYYGENPKEAPENIKGIINSGYGCSCGNERCLKLSRDGRCIFGDICPANTYCCTDQKSAAYGTSHLYEVVLADPSVAVPLAGSNPGKTQIGGVLDALAKRYGIPADVLKAVAYQESTWRCQLTGDNGYANGLMQINVQKYHQQYNVALGKSECSYNAEYGASYLASLFAQHRSWDTAVKRYNGDGDAAVRYQQNVSLHIQNKPWRQWGVA